MRTFESLPMHRPISRCKTRADRQKPVAEIRLGRRTHADARACGREEIELAPVGVGRVHDRRPGAEAARLREQLDRPQPVLGEALLDLARLLVGVHVERQVVLRGIGAELS